MKSEYNSFIASDVIFVYWLLHRVGQKAPTCSSTDVCNIMYVSKNYEQMVRNYMKQDEFP